MISKMYDPKFWKKLPSEVTLIDWDAKKINLTDVGPAPVELRKGKDWHIGVVASRDPLVRNIEIGMILAILPQWGSNPKNESRGFAACGWKRASLSLDDQLIFEEGGSKGDIE